MLMFMPIERERDKSNNRAMQEAVISTTMHAWTKYGMDVRRSISHFLALFGCEPSLSLSAYIYSEYIYVFMYCCIDFLIYMMNYCNDMYWCHRLAPMGNAS
jgi:hypothetical protein